MPVQAITVQRIKARTEASGAKLWAHPTWKGIGSGPLMGFDFAHAPFYPRQGTPVQGDLLVDIARKSNGVFQIPTAQANTPRFVGGGIEWSGLASTAQGTVGVETGSGAALDIATGGNQYFLLCLYVRLPDTTAWPLVNGSITPWIDFSTPGISSTYQNSPSLIAIGPWPNASNRRVAFIRQTTAAGAAVTSYVLLPTYPAGEFAQIAYYRTASGATVHVRTASTGILGGTDVVGAENALDLTNVVAKIGPRSAFSNLATSSIKTLYAGMRQYTIFIENLRLTGRDPAAVLDADWNFMQQRIAAGDINPAAA
ncbi:hypothetical protein [Ancylobacter lacus]|uniref:hypothetical protein n=1 Tax=Ancylobacter lacus TaxID=2579970 RepID=UPI001BCE33A2|nr:hypothetical protein [Ancylobacter lacus]MBS7538231.1 hypothetical protein [Ancylobacter lacus]